jgi:hypothetical protein
VVPTYSTQDEGSTNHTLKAAECKKLLSHQAALWLFNLSGGSGKNVGVAGAGGWKEKGRKK